MKKIWLCAFSLIAVMILFTGCDKSNNPMAVDNPTVEGPALYTIIPPSGAFTTPIKAGQTINVGNIYCWFDADNIYVYYRTVSPWFLTEYHVQVALDPTGFPLSGGGAIPGQFEKKGVIDPIADEKLVTYPLTTEMKAATQLCVAAHCVVVKVVDNLIVDTQTGWGEGPGFPGNNWSMYFWVIVKKTLNLPTGAVKSQFTKITYATEGGIPALFHIWNFDGTGLDIQPGYYNSWCLDHGIYIYGNEYTNTHLWTSVDVNMPNHCRYNRDGITLTPYDKINYMLNKYLPVYTGTLPIAISDGMIIKLQHCFWYYRGDMTLAALSDEEKLMVADANLNGDGFWPAKGQWMAVVIDNSATTQICFLLIDP